MPSKKECTCPEDYPSGGPHSFGCPLHASRAKKEPTFSDREWGENFNRAWNNPRDYVKNYLCVGEPRAGAEQKLFNLVSRETQKARIEEISNAVSLTDKMWERYKDSSLAGGIAQVRGLLQGRLKELREK